MACKENNDANVLVHSATLHSVGIVFVLSFKPTNVKLLIKSCFQDYLLLMSGPRKLFSILGGHIDTSEPTCEHMEDISTALAVIIHIPNGNNR